MKKSEYYKDIIFYIETRLQLNNALYDLGRSSGDKIAQTIVEQCQTELEKWAEEEVEMEGKE